VETLGPVVADKGVPSQDSMVPVLGGQEGEEQLINMFKSQELKYQDCPTQPKETRRYIIYEKIKPDNIHFYVYKMIIAPNILRIKHFIRKKKEKFA
jgi:hypothetical protein